MAPFKKIVLSCIVLLVGNVSAVFAVGEDPASDKVSDELSVRHVKVSVADLENIAGGQDKLVARLMQLRTKETPPFVGVRAEKILLGYSARPEVKAALESDVQSASYRGLARIIATNIDKVSDVETRRSLARHIVQRGEADAEFKMLSKTFASSADSEVARMAK